MMIEDTSDRPGAPARRPPRWVWIALVVVTTSAFTVFLLSLGSRGSEISGVLSLTVAVLAALPTLAAYFKPGVPARERRPELRNRRIVLVVVAAVLGVSLAAGYWFFGGRADLNITEDVVLSQSSNLGDGAKVEIIGRDRQSTAGPFTPPLRDNLAVTFTLRNAGTTGYCVGAAKVDFLVAVDGEPVRPDRPAATAASGDEVNLDLSTATRTASVTAVLSIPDKECQVSLRLDRVLLYN